MIHLASGSGSAEACIDLTKWVQRPLRVRQMLRGHYQLFVKLNLIQLKVKQKPGLKNSAKETWSSTRSQKNFLVKKK